MNPKYGETREDWGPIKEARFKRAHAEGLADWQLAERFGVSLISVTKKRRHLRIHANQDPLAAV